MEVVEHMEPAAQALVLNAEYQLARARLVRDEEWAQETQRSINEEGNETVRAPKRLEKLYLVNVYRPWEGLHDHLMDHALLKHCAEELEQAGYSYKLPTGGATFSDAETFEAAVAAAGKLAPLKCYQMLATKGFLVALKTQLKTKPREGKVRAAGVRSVKLVANFFGPDGAELRTVSTQRRDPSDFGDL